MIARQVKIIRQRGRFVQQHTSIVGLVPTSIVSTIATVSVSSVSVVSIAVPSVSSRIIWALVLIAK